MNSPLIILNPGHNMPGGDPGACANGLKEAELNVQICRRIADLAPQYGFSVVTICENELADICSKANAYADAVLFYSVHCNGGGGTGYEDYTYSQSSAANAYRDIIRAEVTSYLSQFGFPDRGAKYNSSLYVLRNTNMPAILTENLFVDNSKDAQKLADATFLDGLASAHVKGLANALGNGEITPITDSVPEWAQEAIDWAAQNELIYDKIGDEDFYRFVVVLYRFYNKFIIT